MTSLRIGCRTGILVVLRLSTSAAPIVAVDLFEHALGRRQTLAGVLGGLLVVRTFRAQRVGNRTIAFVTAVFVHLVAGLMGEGHPERPWRGVRLRVLDAQLEIDHVRIDPGNPLGGLERLARADTSRHCYSI